MMKIKVLISVLFLALFSVPAWSEAAVTYFGPDYQLNHGETITENLYLAVRQAVLAGNTSRDVVIGAGKLLTSGRVAGDFTIFSGLTDLDGEVSGDLRFLGGNLNLTGRVGGDITAAAGELIITKDARVSGDALVAAGRLVIDGEVSGALHAAGGEVTINSRVTGPVMIWAERLILGDRAIIDGDLTYRSKIPVEIRKGAVVRGKTNYQPVNDLPVFSRESFNELFNTFRLALLLGSILVIFVLFKFTPEALRHTLVFSLERPGRSLLLGFATFFVVPFAVLILVISVFGLPLSLFLLLGYIQIFLLSRVLAGAILGVGLFRLIFRSATYEVSWQALLAGPGLIFILGHLPFIGWLVLTLGFFLAFGSLINLIWLKLSTTVEA